MLQAGDSCPDFTLETESGTTVSLKSLEGKRFVLYFYPKDDTPGCTTEACGFRDLLPAFAELDAQVFGVSADSVAKHRKFVDKHSLGFTLLADPERTLIEPIGAWVEKSMYGKKYMGIARISFVVDANGKIEKVWEKVAPAKHPDEVRAYLAGE